ncbi:hypothetical protein EIN_321650 [Entamoeba invadens IP1]|uniref:Uncharacterized protein n=1 Tax=Entamoeba invadens IP1 TaxID=370355 RepID=A0A0A1UFX3_ENTIV|nr:hypothetical protein EIN_321650 [Entamoeba invadens IP1]ELP93742.1 hypothetical protein EIN_321650 [Entamoeba invadens IP1]|eukprot:XP_004260513.1 hypothetical protein EIN_321650 [Entamoeba invadens IP1]
MDYVNDENDVKAINDFYNQNRCNPHLLIYKSDYDTQLEMPLLSSESIFMMQAVDENDSERICQMIKDMQLNKLFIDCSEAICDNQEFLLDLRKATTLEEIRITRFGGKLSIPDSIKIISINFKDVTIVTNNAKIVEMSIKCCNANGLRVEEGVLKKVYFWHQGLGFTFVHNGGELKNTLYIDNIDFDYSQLDNPDDLKVYKEGKQIVLKKE